MIDQIVLLRESLDKYEKVKKRYFLIILDNLRKLKAAGDEEKVKEELDIIIKMIPRIRAVLGEEEKKFYNIKDVRIKISAQKNILDELEKYCKKYILISSSETAKLNEVYNKIYEIIINFVKFCENIEKTKIKNEN
ncbi:MAG: hypothetical protein QXG86_01115 [Candidatus Woesearchaeota archaeon]